MKWKVFFALLFLCLTPMTVYGKASKCDQMEPVQFLIYFDICNGCLVGNDLWDYQVPTGKRLVIEYIAVKVLHVSPGDSVDVYLSTTVGADNLYHHLGVAEPVDRPVVNPGIAYPYRFVSKQVKLYADPETWVGGWANRLSRVGVEIYPTEVWFTVSGYLINAN